ncbi:hypothetical protein Ana3638_11830 [Anaerocolumna sedimenticola]|uniref:Uncharacterized protein n=1 Tax=Anaerocolumna sedimenticola TaxID=2696063 RepID=A0A6P1TM54_9FIRM|nr:hypothetical protein [Anaerocolumna sedimenticola]QHQ61377.1 hypothetical protein Ana3638_11830 [Anaerocolumna sedimenticola]
MIEVAKNYFAQNLDKNKCHKCGNEFIVGLESKQGEERTILHCPFCGSLMTESTACTTDEILREFDDCGLLGCSWIYLEKPDDDIKVLKE